MDMKTISNYKDTLHGYSVMSANKVMAWQKIRNICHEKGIKVPTLDKIIKVK